MKALKSGIVLALIILIVAVGADLVRRTMGESKSLMKLGRSKSAWLVAASLDRYLMNIGQPQIFGSQFNHPVPADQSKWTNEPYDEKLVSDSLRKIFYQPTLEETKNRLEGLKTNKPLAPTSPN